MKELSRLEEKWMDELAPLILWFTDNAPKGASLKWGDHHVSTGPEFVHTGWVDVQIPEMESELGWGWVWTIVEPGDQDEGASATVIACPHDVTIWRIWDDDSYWWHDEPFVITPAGVELTEEQRALFVDHDPIGVGGWTAKTISAALGRWCTANLGRDDVTFTYDDEITSPSVAEAEETLFQIKNGTQETYEIAPGIAVSGGVLDDLLSMDSADAAQLSSAIIDAISKVRNEGFPESRG